MFVLGLSTMALIVPKLGNRFVAPIGTIPSNHAVAAAEAVAILALEIPTRLMSRTHGERRGKKRKGGEVPTRLQSAANGDRKKTTRVTAYACLQFGLTA